MSETGATKDPGCHWDEVYGERVAHNVSWFQPEPQISLALIESLGATVSVPVVDIGGGASLLVDRLVSRGWRDVTVLDVSDTGLRIARDRLPGGAPVAWLHQDILVWHPARRYGLWHDRAVFHFLVAAEDRQTYLDLLEEAVEPGGSVILATFSLDGPEYCSGLPVARYSAEELTDLLAGHGFEVVETRQENHFTPAGAVQAFVWVAARKVRQ